MDRFTEMQTFNAVVDAGSFVKAADALEMSKAAVSRNVLDLEARLGVRLLHRTTRRLSLTDEGQVFYGRSKELLAELDEAEAQITAHTDAARGVLRISAPISFGVLHLAPLWGLFKLRHPKVELEITLSDRIVDLVDEGYDLAVRIAMLENSSLVSRKLASTRIVLCASPEYLRRHGTPTHPSELARHQVIGYSLSSAGDDWPFDGPDGPVSVKTRPCIRTNSGDTCRAIALAHQGIVMQPSFTIGPDLAAGTLVELMPEYRTLELGIHAVYPTRKHVSAKVRALIDFLAENFKGRGPAW